MADDSVEESKLLNQHHAKARLRELAGDEWEKEETCENSQTIEQLRETIKTERDQKVKIVSSLIQALMH